MKLLITDLENIEFNNIEKYDKILILIYSTFDDKLSDHKYKNNNNIEYITTEYYYAQIYKEINNYISSMSNDNFFIGFVKSIRLKLYDLFFIYIVYKENFSDDIFISTKFNNNVKKLIKNKKVTFVKSNENKSNKNFLKIAYILLRVCMSFINNMIYKNKTIDILFLDYKKQNVIKHYLDKFNSHSVIDLDFDFGIFRGKINVINITLFIKIFYKLFLISRKHTLIKDYLYIPLFYSLKYANLLSQYNTKVILGVLDDGFAHEILYEYCKVNKVKLICHTHCVHLYPFKTEFLHNPFDFYIVSSPFYKMMIEKLELNYNNCKYLNIGYINYGFEKIQKIITQYKIKKYDLIFVGDYYHDTLAINPFTKNLTKRISYALLELSKTYKILVRPRSKDKYYEDMYKILGNNVDYSVHSERPTIYEDIKSASLGIGAYSNAIKDGLLIEVPFIHLDWINLKTTFIDMVNDNAVYYSKNENELFKLIHDFFDNQLEPLEYKNNNEKYMYSGKFEPKKVIEIIKELI